jgi:DNA-directed RNA polymerase subunit RPC12/RpoP
LHREIGWYVALRKQFDTASSACEDKKQIQRRDEDVTMADNPAIKCPACEKKFKTKADVRGKRIKCPFCSESFIVPMVEEPTEDDDAPIPFQGAAKKDAAAPDEDEWTAGETAYDVTTLDLAPRCPNCANEMPSADAVVCLICGYNTLTRVWGKTEKTIGITFGRHMVYLLPGILSVFAILSCLIGLIMYATYWPFWVAGADWISWTDHESLRMWGTTVAMGVIVALARYSYIRFVVKPLPDEMEME